MKDKFTTWKRNKPFTICRSNFIFEKRKTKQKKKKHLKICQKDKKYCVFILEEF